MTTPMSLHGLLRKLTSLLYFVSIQITATCSMSKPLTEERETMRFRLGAITN